MTSKYVVRFGSTRNLAEFNARGDQQFPRGAQVVVRSDRGVEWGEVLCAATDRTAGFLGGGEARGRILRIAGDQDRVTREELIETEREEFDACKGMIAERKLQMELVDVEHIFGGERVIFYYLAEKRVDFRELVKALAKQLRTRIEMRQIGVRDEARLLADYGDCGKPVCCNTHLHEMPPVSMKMAKIQKATLDPSKISGRCGRLKCCLRYEYDTYVEYRRELPRMGATVMTREGQGRVIGQEILARKIVVRFEDHRQQIVNEADVLTVVNTGGKTSKKATTNGDAS